MTLGPYKRNDTIEVRHPGGERTGPYRVTDQRLEAATQPQHWIVWQSTYRSA